MCDEYTQKDADEFLRRSGVTRREFGQISAVAGLAAMLPGVANAQAVTETDVEVTTPDGVADCYLVHPATGRHPAVLVWPDILGLRPAFRAMGKRLAESGYTVLTVNPFYRDARSPVVEEGASFADPETRNIVFPMAGNLNADTHFTDARAFVSFLDQQSAVDTGKEHRHHRLLHGWPDGDANGGGRSRSAGRRRDLSRWGPGDRRRRQSASADSGHHRADAALRGGE